MATPPAGYAMYVWTNSYDATVPSCTEGDFLSWNTSDRPCFTHSWNTESKRAWLWNTCSKRGREITSIYLSGALSAIKNASESGDYSVDELVVLRKTLKEGHAKVPGLRICALFADSDRDVSEKDKVAYVVYYNDHCAGCDKERFDGVAVNNEAYGAIKCPKGGNSDRDRAEYLDKLRMVQTEAEKQMKRRLLTHYSMGWHWGLCEDTNLNLVWNGKVQTATRHMIDIFDSTDVQVAATDINDIKHRLDIAGFQYARDTGKEMFTTLYLNKASPSRTTFFPLKDDDPSNLHTEEGLWNVVDSFHDHGIADAKPCLHYFRGVYSSGGNKDWPA